MPTRRTGLLIIRAWLEEGSTDPLRAQISMTHDVGTGIERSVTLVQTDDVSDLVAAWIREMIAANTEVV